MTLLFHCDESYDDRYHLHLGLLSTGAQAAQANAAVRKLVQSISWDMGVVATELHGYPLFSGRAEWDGVGAEERIDVYRHAIDIIRQNELEVLYRGN